MRRLLVLPALLAACGGSPLEHGVHVDVDRVVLGQAFRLTVVQTEPPGDLALRLVDEDGETRRYDAYAFMPGEILVGDKTITVEPTLDPDNPGEPELPAPPTAPFPWWPVVAAVAVAALALLLLRRRRPVRVEPAVIETEPPPGPHVRALQRIGRLRAADVPDDEFYVEATSLLREYARERFAIRATEMTTQQLAAVLPRLGPPLRRADLVKFARHRPTTAERDQLLADAEDFVRETAE